MSWRKAKAAINKKPYLLDPYRQRSLADANVMLAGEQLPAPEEIFERVRLRMGFDTQQWEDYLGMSSKKLKRKCRNATPVRFGSVFTLSRRAVVALAILIAVTTFMACTPIGRKWAVAAYNAVSEVIDGILYIRSEDKPVDEVLPEPEVIGVDSSTIEFDSLEEMLEKVDKPVFYLDSDDIVSARFQMTSSMVYGEYLESEYEFGDGVKVIVKQDWDIEFEDRIGAEKSKQHISIELTNDIVIDGVYTDDDMVFVGAIITKDMRTKITIMRTSVDNIITILQTFLLQ